RFKVEARMLSQLENYHLPAVYDYFIEKGRYYLVMSYIEGVDLSDLLELEGNPGLPEELVIEWSVQILDVLDYLHNQDPPVVYRDIKPGNIMLNKDGRIMLVDFGIARTIIPDANIKYTSIGTDGYAAEEQYRGKVEPRSDIYSLGATMHHLLTGKIPSAFNLKPVRNYAPWVSPGIEQIVMKALEYEAEKRYRNAAEMKEALCGLMKKDEPKPKVRISAHDLEVYIPGKKPSLLHTKKPVSYEEIKETFSEEELSRINTMETARKTEELKNSSRNSVPLEAKTVQPRSLFSLKTKELIVKKQSKIKDKVGLNTRSLLYDKVSEKTPDINQTGGEKSALYESTDIIKKDRVSEIPLPGVGTALHNLLQTSSLERSEDKKSE
ncbi:MAG: serine/threonine-protein kinase, partial [Candidatus Eremiobacterota bacterium]